MGLIDDAANTRAALESVRAGEAARITEAVRENRIVGLLGEAEVGKTETVRQALAALRSESKVLQLDLDGAASEEHVAFLLAKQIARAQMGVDFSLLTVGALLPSSVEAGRVELAELLGIDGLDEAMREWPSGEYPLPRALSALATLASRGEVILWIDHLEAPSLTPRHPLQVDNLLWGMREIAQREPGLRLILSAREAIGAQVLGAAAAFHQQGRWLSIDNPSAEAWIEVADELNVSSTFADELVGLLRGHPAAVQLGLLRAIRSRSPLHAYETVQELAILDAGLTARAMQHARSLHRLGGQLLIQVAYGLGPYAADQRGKAPPQEIRKVLGRLQLAGLLRHAPETWSLVNPLIAFGIRQGVREP